MRNSLPDDHKVETWQELCLALGGDRTSFTGQLLELIQKADPGNRARLRAGFPKHVAAWEMWVAGGGRGLTAGMLTVALEAVLDPAA